MIIINKTLVKRKECFVSSESTKGAYYKVVIENGEYGCTCPNNLKNIVCKHIRLVQEDGELEDLE